MSRKNRNAKKMQKKILRHYQIYNGMSIFKGGIKTRVIQEGKPRQFNAKQEKPD